LEKVEKKEVMKTQNLVNNKSLTVGAIVLGLVLLAFYFKSIFVVAIVNGKPIFRSTIVSELESQGGEQILDQKILEMLIVQKAGEQGIAVSDADVEEEIIKITENLSSQGQDLATVLATQGMDEFELRKQIRLQKMIEQLQPEASEPTEEDIEAALVDQADFFPEDMTDEERRSAVIDQLTKQQEGSVVEDWLTSLKDEASIQYWKVY